MDPYATPGSERRERYDRYLQTFFKANEDSHPKGWRYKANPFDEGQLWTDGLANQILESNYHGYHDMRFMALEADSELIYPSVAYESESVLGEFAGVSGQRIAQIINYGQQGDVLSNTLNKLKKPR